MMVQSYCQYEQSDLTPFGSWKHGRHRIIMDMDAFVPGRRFQGVSTRRHADTVIVVSICHDGGIPC